MIYFEYRAKECQERIYISLCTLFLGGGGLNGLEDDPDG